MVERKVHARLDVSGSNPGRYKCAYFVKKLYLYSRGACGGGWNIFFFLILLFLVLFLFFYFLKIDL
jgi:hypothetical protein